MEKANLMRAIVISIGIAVIGVWSTGVALGGDLMYGCCRRPACGKVCKLVCGPATLVAVGYGCECREICVPGPSRPGCKHCETRCCCDNEIKGCRPKIEFCWYDWFACGCAQPRTIRVLTKYQAVKEVPFYHWEVVDGCDDCCSDVCDCVYKPAPLEAQVGDVLELTHDEQVQVASYVSAGHADDGAPAKPQAAKPTSWQRLTKVWPFAHDAE